MMSADVVEQLRGLADSFDEFVGDVSADEVFRRREGVSDAYDPDSAFAGRRGWSRYGLVAAAVVVLVGGLLAIGALRDVDEVSESAEVTVASAPGLVEALVDREWVAIDGPAELPWFRFSRGEGSNEMAVIGSDGCNELEGPFRLDGQQVVESKIFSTMLPCDTTTGLRDGAILLVENRYLIVTDPTGIRTRYVAVDTLTPVGPEELVGTYTVGTTPLTITTDSITSGDCSRPWSVDAGSVVLDGPACDSPYVLGVADRWDDPAGNDQLVVVRVGDDYLRLDRTRPEAPARPGLASFLGAVGERTWVLDVPLSEYPEARRPSLRVEPEWNADGDLLVTGFDGCNTYAVNGSWIPDGSGWSIEATSGESTTVGCDPDSDRPILRVGNGDMLSLDPDGLLVITEKTGNELALRDIRAATRVDMVRSPLGDLAGRWELDPGVEIEITPLDAEGEGEIRLGDCVVAWRGLGNEWIGAGPVPPACAESFGGTSVSGLLNLLDTESGRDPGRQITVGMNLERNVAYLAETNGTTVYRLTRIG